MGIEVCGMLITMLSPYQPGYPIDLRSPEMQMRAAQSPYGDFEAAAARVVSRATGLKTVIQDDNRQARTPDFRIEYNDVEVGVFEAVLAADPGRAGVQRALAQQKLEFESTELKWLWWVTLTPRVRRDRLELDLVPVLAGLEASGRHLTLAGRPSLDPPLPEVVALEQQGFIEALCDPNPRGAPGKVIGLPEGIGGPVAIDWDGCDRWITEFLASELCRRKLKKMVDAEPDQQHHLYVGVTGAVPWPVHQVLEHHVIDVDLPPPRLPDGHLWLHSAEFPGRAITWWPERGWFDTRTHWATE